MKQTIAEMKNDAMLTHTEYDQRAQSGIKGIEALPLDEQRLLLAHRLEFAADEFINKPGPAQWDKLLTLMCAYQTTNRNPR